MNLDTVVGHVGDERPEPITLRDLESEVAEMILRHEARRHGWLADQMQWQSSLAVCRERGQRIAELEARLAKAEAALKAAPVEYCLSMQGGAWAPCQECRVCKWHQQKREAMK